MGIDLRALRKLYRLGGTVLVDKMVAAGIANLEQKAREIAAAGPICDHEAAARAAHSLRSSAGNLGLTELQRLGAEIELAGNQREQIWIMQIDQVNSALQEMHERLPAAVRSLERAIVAIVEDNADNRLLLQALLEDRYEIRSFVDGKSALAGLQVELPDLLLLDISLPEMDGPTLLRQLRAEPRSARLPIVALTAHAMAGDRERFLDMGFDGYLAKPIVDEDQLYELIRRLLARKA